MRRPPLTSRLARFGTSVFAEMTALARAHGWPTAGYQHAGHPVHDRLLTAVAEWTGVPREQVHLGVDGCTTVCYGLPLEAMARAYARLVTSAAPAARQVRDLLSGLVLSNVFCMICFALFYKLTKQEMGSGELAWRSLIHFTVYPATFFLVAAYSESTSLFLPWQPGSLRWRRNGFMRGFLRGWPL